MQAGAAPERELLTEIRAARDLDVGVLGMEPTAGLLLDPRLATGRNPREVEVALFDAAGREMVAERHLVPASGRVSLETAPSGTWEVIVRTAGLGYVGRAESVQVPGPPPTPTLGEAASLLISVPDLETSPDVATLILPDERGRSFHWDGSPLRFGRATIRSLLPGVWTVEGVATGRSWRSRAEIGWGREVEVVLENPE